MRRASEICYLVTRRLLLAAPIAFAVVWIVAPDRIALERDYVATLLGGSPSAVRLVR
jgi:hypothetical protein